MIYHLLFLVDASCYCYSFELRIKLYKTIMAFYLMQGWYLTTMIHRPSPTYRTPPHRLWNGRYLQPTIFFEAQQTLLCLHAFRKRSGITDKPPNSIQLSPNKSDNVLMSRNHHIGGYVVLINSLLITAMVVGDLLMLPSQQREPQFMAFGEQISRHITSICVSAHSNFWHFFFSLSPRVDHDLIPEHQSTILFI